MPYLGIVGRGLIVGCWRVGGVFLADRAAESDGTDDRHLLVKDVAIGSDLSR